MEADITDPLEVECSSCGAEAGEACRPDCIGQAAELDNHYSNAQLQAAHDAHIAAIGGRCSHGGHGWEDTCSDIDDALAGR